LLPGKDASDDARLLRFRVTDLASFGDASAGEAEIGDGWLVLNSNMRIIGPRAALTPRSCAESHSSAERPCHHPLDFKRVGLRAMRGGNTPIISGERSLRPFYGIFSRRCQFGRC